MQKTKQTSTRLLVITITTAAIIAAVTTVSISGAAPAFAKINCNETETVCSGGAGSKPSGFSSPGGGGGRIVLGESGAGTASGGFGGQLPTTGGDTLVGGTASHFNCDAFGSCTHELFHSGQHLKGPGGNSDK